MKNLEVDNPLQVGKKASSSRPARDMEMAPVSSGSAVLQMSDDDGSGSLRDSFVSGMTALRDSISNLDIIRNTVHQEEPKTNSEMKTCFLMLNTMIGSGILNQPQVFSVSGVVGALITFAVSGYFIWLGAVMVIQCGVKTNNKTYQSLVSDVLGENGQKLLDFLIVVGNTGAVMSYLTLIGGTTSGLLLSWGVPYAVGNVYLVTTVMTTVFVLPLSLNRYYGHLGFISYISIGSITVIMLLVLIAGPVIGDGEGSVHVINIDGMFQKIGSVVFALSMLPASFHAFESTHKADIPMWKRIMTFTVLAGCGMCITIGLAGYLSFRRDTQGEILDNFTGSFGDPFDVMLIIHIILYVPVDFIIFRYSAVRLIKGKELTEELSAGWHILLTIVMLYSCMILELILFYEGYTKGEAFGIILDFSGGLAFSLVCFILPSAVYYKVFQDEGSAAEYYYQNIAMFIFGLFIFFAVPIATFLED